jgi:hypothetical protein
MPRRTRVQKKSRRYGGFRINPYVYQLRTNLIPASIKKTNGLVKFITNFTRKAARNRSGGKK